MTHMLPWSVCRIRLSKLVFALLLLICSLLPSAGHAQPGRDKSPLSWDRRVGGLFQRYCYRCHKPTDPSGNVDLASDRDVRLIKRNRDKWLNVYDQLESGDMPPEEARQPSDEERLHMMQFLDEMVRELDCESLDRPGRSVLRRLNRKQYDLVVRDLTGLDLSLSESFPADPIRYGFDSLNSGSITPSEFAQYYAAAKEIIRTLLESPLTSTQNIQSQLGPAPIAGASDEVHIEFARRSLNRFANRAFRHPADAEYIDKLCQLFERARSESEESESEDESQVYYQALAPPLQAILVSPNFLNRIERESDSEQASSPVSDFELASRLSFLLWSRGPDDTLFGLAEAGELHDEQELRSQVDRMLEDDRSEVFVEQFLLQWLDLKKVEDAQPDADIFPDFTMELKSSMLEEVRLLCKDLVQSDLPLTSLIDADFLYADPRLAKHYGLEVDFPAQKNDVDGRFRRVEMDGLDSSRGGVLTSAAWLMSQSDANRTNIPKRGNFVAAQFMGAAPPPPPPNVPVLDSTEESEGMTMRERFVLHRSNSDCRGCHAKIDPFGFALENFDAIGQFRTKEFGQDIDSVSRTSGGQRLDGIAGLKSYLLENQDRLVREIAKNLMIYALGRGLEPSDECVIREMCDAAQETPTLRRLLHVLVTSTPFTHRSNAE